MYKELPTKKHWGDGNSSAAVYYGSDVLCAWLAEIFKYKKAKRLKMSNE